MSPKGRSAAKHFSAAKDMIIVPKAWGEEHWIVNKEYCGKKLILKRNMRCSMHQHKEKDEVFYLQSGKVLMELGGKEYTLNPGDSMHVPRNTPHRFTGIEHSEIMEFSTTHREDDSYRQELSGHIDPERFSRESTIIQKFPKARILVVGDVMLDTWIHGSAERISPEAPVPVVKYVSEEATAGGAANVAANIVGLGGNATLIGVTGRDEAGKKLKEILKKRGIRMELETDSSRCTTHKTRIVGHQRHQMMRFDREQTHALDTAIEKRLLASIRENLRSHDVLLLSDYAKGVFSPAFLKECIQLAKQRKVPVLIDPKPRNTEYLHAIRGVHLLFPNLSEADILTGNKQYASVEKLAAALARMAKANVLVTAGGKGMVLVEKKTTLFPALTHSVVDVSGAGDTVAATVALSIATGASLTESADLGNRAASVVVTKPGTATLTPQELLDTL